MTGSTSAPHVECDWPRQGGVTAFFSLSIDDKYSGCLAPNEAVSGVGDEACFGDVGLHVKHGAWDVVFFGVEGVTKEQEIQLAKVALPRF